MKTSERITTWLPTIDIPWLNSEKKRLEKKGWVTEVVTRESLDKKRDSIKKHSLIVHNSRGK